jgi:Uma2 family endonuclease
MNVRLPPRSTQAAEGLPRRRFTVAEIEAMVAAGIIDAHERVELIGGDMVPMAPKGLEHEILKNALHHRWVLAAPKHFRIVVATTFRLSEDTYLEPDNLLYPNPPGLTGITGPNVPLVVEIADNSLAFDLGRKAGLYASFGVRELWVIDAIKTTTHVFLRPSPEGYRDTSELGAADRVTPAFAPEIFALRLDQLKLV